VGKVISKRRN